jgi:hypothetical protein
MLLPSLKNRTEKTTVEDGPGWAVSIKVGIGPGLKTMKITW